MNEEIQFKGTHGPWQVVDDYDNYVPYSVGTPQIYIWNGDEQAHKAICDMGEMGDMNYAEELANANLIATAPDLLKRLQWLHQFIGPYLLSKGEVGEMEYQLTECIIKKALGNTNKQ